MKPKKPNDKTNSTAQEPQFPESLAALDGAIRKRAAILQKEMASDLRNWADSHGVLSEDELVALARGAYSVSMETMPPNPAIIRRVTERVLDRITNIH